MATPDDMLGDEAYDGPRHVVERARGRDPSRAVYDDWDAERL